METKKSPKADLDSKKLTFTLIGLVLALLAVWGVFEYKSYEKKNNEIFLARREIIDDDIAPVTKQEQPKPEIKIVRPQQVVITIAKEGEEVENDIDINAEIGQGEAVVGTYYIPPVIEDEVIEEKEPPFVVVEDMPEFPGGEGKRIEFISKNIKYPMVARESGIQGKVYVKYIVEKDGSISNVEVVRGIGGGCDEEAVRVIQSMPNWKPGKQRGNPVRVEFIVPISFKLQ